MCVVSFCRIRLVMIAGVLSAFILHTRGMGPVGCVGGGLWFVFFPGCRRLTRRLVVIRLRGFVFVRRWCWPGFFFGPDIGVLAGGLRVSGANAFGSGRGGCPVARGTPGFIGIRIRIFSGRGGVFIAVLRYRTSGTVGIRILVGGCRRRGGGGFTLARRGGGLGIGRRRVGAGGRRDEDGELGDRLPLLAAVFLLVLLLGGDELREHVRLARDLLLEQTVLFDGPGAILIGTADHQLDELLV